MSIAPHNRVQSVAFRPGAVGERDRGLAGDRLLHQTVAATMELMLAHLCSKHVCSPSLTLPISVGMLPENRRRSKHVRFGYGIYVGEDFVPAG